MAKRLCLFLASFLLFIISFFILSFFLSGNVLAQTCTDYFPTLSSLPSCSTPLFGPTCNGGTSSFTGTQCCQNLQFDYCEDTQGPLTPQYRFRCCSNPPAPPPPPPACVTDSDCTDGNACTTDACFGSGQPGSFCTHDPALEGTVCLRDPSTFEQQMCCSAEANCSVDCAPAPPPPSCPAITCSFSEGVPTSVCESGERITTGTGCSGFNCGCNFVSGCSTSSCTQPPPPAPSGGPSLNAFAGSSSCPDPARYLAPFKASLSWSGTPFDTGSCGSGFWVDVDNDNNWGNGAYHKCVSTTSTSASTVAPDGFNGFGGPTGSLTFQSGQTYYARVYNGKKYNSRLICESVV